MGGGDVKHRSVSQSLFEHTPLFAFAHLGLPTCKAPCVPGVMLSADTKASEGLHPKALRSRKRAFFSPGSLVSGCRYCAISH